MFSNSTFTESLIATVSPWNLVLAVAPLGAVLSLPLWLSLYVIIVLSAEAPTILMSLVIVTNSLYVPAAT